MYIIIMGVAIDVHYHKGLMPLMYIIIRVVAIDVHYHNGCCH